MSDQVRITGKGKYAKSSALPDEETETKAEKSDRCRCIPALQYHELSLTCDRSELPAPFKMRPRPGGYLRYIVPPNDVHMSLTDIWKRSESMYELLSQLKPFECYSEIVKPTSKLSLDRYDKPCPMKAKRETKSLKENPEEQADTTRAWEDADILSTVVSTVMLLAYDREAYVDDRYPALTVNFLQTVKDDDGNIPHNIANILHIIESRYVEKL